jgi:hypothetical protein
LRFPNRHGLTEPIVLASASHFLENIKEAYNFIAPYYRHENRHQHELRVLRRIASVIDMQDGVRPDWEAFKAMYERGYCTWFSLYEMTISESQNRLPWWDSLLELQHPSFPEELAVDASFSNSVLVKGISTWRTSKGSCDLPSFDQEFIIPVASDRPTLLEILDQEQSASMFPSHFSEEDSHIAVLILAWTYILSARWAEIIPGASGPEYTNFQATTPNVAFESTLSEEAVADSNGFSVDLGEVDDDAAHWWAAVLAQGGDWNATILSDKGHILHSPWYTKLPSEQCFTLSHTTKSHPLQVQHPAASFSNALRYLSSYCEFHNISEQMNVALAATLLLPVAKFDNRKIQLPHPRARRKIKFENRTNCKAPVWSENLNQLDKLITLSCNAVGTKALLNSVFYESGVECNICGAWLQGTFAFLDSDIMQDQDLLLRALMKRDPSIGFIWLGAFIIGAHTRALQEARLGWWKLDLHTAAWTGTLISFIQEPVSTIISETDEIPRADEARLMYLSHDQSYVVPPLFPFRPFGSTALKDTNIDVRQHVKCGTSHLLEYESLSWRCRGGLRNATLPVPKIPLHAKNGQNQTETNISINYDKLDNEDDDCSEMVTRNIFTWLRDEDGFPVAERAIREHEWIDNLDSDDDEPITGDTNSTVRGNLHGWLWKTLTTRSNSL